MQTKIELKFDCSEERLSRNGNCAIVMYAYITINGKRLYTEKDNLADLEVELDFFEASEHGFDYFVGANIVDNRENFEIIRVLMLTLGEDLEQFLTDNSEAIYNGGMSGIYNKEGNILEKTF